eukprot:scaffold323831_cov23-Tisochrysis_lutea.AAC.1
MQRYLAAGSCSSPYSMSLEIGGTAEVKDIDTCEQTNSFALDTGLSSQDFVVLLESSSVMRQIKSSATASGFFKRTILAVSQQCSTDQTSDSVVSEETDSTTT